MPKCHDKKKASKCDQIFTKLETLQTEIFFLSQIVAGLTALNTGTTIASGNVLVGPTGEIIDTSFNGVSAATQGTPGFFVLTAPVGKHFVSVQATSVLTGNLPTQGTELFGTVPTTDSLGTTVSVNFPWFGSGGEVVAVSVLATLRSP